MLEGGMFGWLGWIVVGGIAGVIAKVIVPGKDPGGIIVTILLGVAGALLMGFLGTLIGLEGDGAGIIGAIVGAIVLLSIYKLINKSRGGDGPPA